MTLGTVAFLLVEVVIGMSPAHFEVCTRASGRPAIPGGVLGSFSGVRAGPKWRGQGSNYARVCRWRRGCRVPALLAHSSIRLVNSLPKLPRGLRGVPGSVPGSPAEEEGGPMLQQVLTPSRELPR